MTYVIIYVRLLYCFPPPGACGKTSLLCCFALGEFPKEYVRVVYASFFLCVTNCVFVLNSVYYWDFTYNGFYLNLTRA